MSLRYQLLLRLIVISVIMVGGSVWFGYQHVRYEARELFDAQLARSARMILSLAQAQNGDSGFSRIQEYLDENGLAVMYINFEENTDTLETDAGHIYETKLAFQIWDNEGNLVVKSYNAPLEPLSTLDGGFNNITVDAFDWRTFSLLSSNRQYRCITAERKDVRNDLIIKISNDLFYMFIILVPALTLVMYLTINKGLMPLQQLATQINRRSENNLTPLKNDDRHSEIVTIKNSLNKLLNRLNETLDREKRVTSDAAHELRTPLAAIRLHTELAKNAETEQQKNDSLELVMQGVDRTTHLVEQLLTLARLEPEILANDFSQVNMAALIIEECALLSPLALDKNIDITFDDQSVHGINGHEASLRLLIRNLLNNAINYTQHDGKVDITLSTRDPHMVLTIEDNGPGLSENELKRVTERFYRGKNQQTPGCGIGLSIVDQVVQIHHGTMQLSQADSGRGLKVMIQF